MARKPTPTLTDGELRLMGVLWQRGECGVSEIQRALTDKLVDSTIRTLLSILEGKGYVARRKEGRGHVYRALITRSDARKSMVERLAHGILGSPAELMLSILDTQDLDASELAEIKAAIQSAEGEP